uniref:EOG090X0BGA n=1 Tax=Alona affinis TaxID=381656 RepID=A0A9N6WP95_9CRUS|nr:EOG090X0BGA [Alona affinis]
MTVLHNFTLLVITVFFMRGTAQGYYYDKAYSSVSVRSRSRPGPVKTLTRCPGQYCGRQLIETENETIWSACGSCPRGSRVNGTWACIECPSSPSAYDWMYLAFMLLLGLLVQWYSIDSSQHHPQTGSNNNNNLKFCFKVLCLHFSAFVETSLAAIITLLANEPYGLFTLRSCPAQKLSDWYTLLHNPNPNYEETLHCAQEAVYPLYSLVFMHYGLSVLMLLLIRPWVNKALEIKGRAASMPIYAGLYLFPALTLIHGTMAGLIYYSFPSIIILLSLMSHAFHFASRSDQSWRVLLQETVSSFHNLIVVLGHWILHGFGLVALTMWLDAALLATILTLVPVPTFLYVVFARFTDPGKFHSD